MKCRNCGLEIRHYRADDEEIDWIHSDYPGYVFCKNALGDPSYPNDKSAEPLNLEDYLEQL